jgi:tetratricopeptide (TPR) repeat protein
MSHAEDAQSSPFAPGSAPGSEPVDLLAGSVVVPVGVDPGPGMVAVLAGLDVRSGGLTAAGHTDAVEAWHRVVAWATARMYRHANALAVAVGVEQAEMEVCCALRLSSDAAGMLLSDAVALAGALAEYQKALTANPNSSLASYRIGEVLFNQRNYQAAANAYRDALRGDDEPKWTEVWSHIALGKIFDVTGQRDRAVNEYRQAVQTNDNTQGAVNEARKYLLQPYKRPDTE